MKPFDLEAAKKGAAVCTRDGRDARIVCWDFKKPNYPIVALVTNDIGEEMTCSYTYSGHELCVHDTSNDLFMKSVKVTKWTNIYFNIDDSSFVWAKLYDTEEEALSQVQKCPSFIHTAKVEWEE